MLPQLTRFRAASIRPRRLARVAVLASLLAFGAVALCSCQQEQPEPPKAAVEEGVRTAEEAVAAGGTAIGGADVQTAFAAYSWDELDRIAREMEASGSEEAAFELAKKYRLVNGEGKLTGDVKPLELADGTASGVQIAGFYHDDKSDGGKAGITFVFASCLPEKLAMNASGYNEGGWAYSDMRLSIEEDAAGLIPAEVGDKAVAVDKLTNNVGASDGDDVISLTSDRFWLFSKTELAGELAESELVNSAVLSQEGSQYQLFSDCGVVDAQDNPVLDKRCNGEYSIWWTRSSVLGLDSGFYVTTMTGSSDDFSYYADNEYGVVPGFCL